MLRTVRMVFFGGSRDGAERQWETDKVTKNIGAVSDSEKLVEIYKTTEMEDEYVRCDYVKTIRLRDWTDA